MDENLWFKIPTKTIKLKHPPYNDILARELMHLHSYRHLIKKA